MAQEIADDYRKQPWWHVSTFAAFRNDAVEKRYLERRLKRLERREGLHVREAPQVSAAGKKLRKRLARVRYADQDYVSERLGDLHKCGIYLGTGHPGLDKLIIRLAEKGELS